MGNSGYLLGFDIGRALFPKSVLDKRFHCPSLPQGLSSPHSSSGENKTLSSLHISQRHSHDERHEGNSRWMAFQPSFYLRGKLL